jgi:F-type H+-transporting ATPase subunit alpha
MPAVNPGISVSRVGGNAQIKAMKKVAGTLKLLYSQYRELQGFAQFGSDLDADTKARLDQGQRIVEVLKQDRNSPIAVELQVAIIYAVVNNLLRDVAIEDIKSFESELSDYLVATKEELLSSIRESGVLTDENAAELREAIEHCKAKIIK